MGDHEVFREGFGGFGLDLDPICMGITVVNLGRKIVLRIANAVSNEPQRASSAHRWCGLVVIEVAV